MLCSVLRKCSFPIAITMHLRTLFIVSVLSLASGQDRKITPVLNPDCKSCSDNTTLVYIRAEGPHDTIYQLWDFTRGTPTVIYAVAGVNSSLTVSWVKDRPVHFNLSEDLQYSFAVAITELIEYNDVVDSGQFNSTGTQRRYPLRELKWTQQKSILTDQEAMLQMHAARYKNGSHWVNGSIEIKLDLLPFRDFSSDLPHLIHTANSSLLDVQLVNLTTSRDYNSSRFALNLLLISTEDPWGSMVQEMKKSLDDEHTPGVFEIIELKTPAVAGGAGGYLQFRPVAYTQRERSVTSSTVVHASAFNSSEIPIPSTLYEFYGQFLLDTNLLIQNVAVSFGEPEDGFYRHDNFTAWSTTIGYGAPPVETFSLFVILVLSIGLSVPVLLALSGVAYVVARRCRALNPPVRLDEQ